MLARRTAPLRLRLTLLWLFAMLILPKVIVASNASRRLLTPSVPSDSHKHAAVHHAPQRRLGDGLDCDVQLYHDFIHSDEGANIFIMATMCESKIKYIRDVRAGKYGPVEQSDLRWAMCSNECLVSDSLHRLAMARSRCTCAQVSANTCVTHDFCRENSARLLCTHLGECGHWNCELEDFMCLRNEWDRFYACDALSLRIGLVSVSLIVVAIVMVL